MGRSRCLAKAVILLSSLLQCYGFSSAIQKNRPVPSALAAAGRADECLASDWQAPPTSDACASRRTALNSILAFSSVPLLLYSNQVAFADDTAVQICNGLDALKDLPQFDPTTTVRVYLARHGETENNRLRKIQGARIDAPINETGKKQAELLGQALARTEAPPELLLHSPLQRAQQTAAIAANQLSTRPPLKKVDSLAELDFGPFAEGAQVEQMRASMVGTYAAWAAGNLDARMAGGGESGQEILRRIESALQTLVMTASESKTGSIAAVAHSSYVRMLLAVVGDMSLFTASQLQQKNCCVNVLDFRRPTLAGIVPRKKDPLRLPGGPVSRLVQLDIPEGYVVRTNEERHLASLQT